MKAPSLSYEQWLAQLRELARAHLNQRHKIVARVLSGVVRAISPHILTAHTDIDQFSAVGQGDRKKLECAI